MVDSAHLKPWILVVDDNGDAADLLALALRLFHYEVRVAYNGFDAVAAALEDRPDVVVLDIGMPFLSGFEVARQIRGALGSNVLLIAHTAWNDSATLGRCKEAGFDHHLTKPADLADILALADPGGSASLGPQTR